MNGKSFRTLLKNIPAWLKVSTLAVVLVITALLWSVFAIFNTRKEQVVNNWLDLQTTIIREAARNSEAWYNLRVVKQKTDPDIVQGEIFNTFITPIEIPGMSEIWVAYADMVFLRRISPFYNGFTKNNLAEFFQKRASQGGSHTEEVLSGVNNGNDGQGWYVVNPQSGKEIVAWTTLKLPDHSLAIGIATQESRLLVTEGVEDEFKRNLIFAVIMSTLLAIIIYLLWREEERIQQLSLQQEKTIQEKSRELEFTHARYKTLVEQITAVTYVNANDVEWTPIFMSPQMERLFGYSQQDSRDHPYLWPEIVHSDDREKVIAEHLRSFETGEPFCMDYRVYTKNGKLIWIHDESVLAVDPEGVKTRQGVMYDISERKAMEEELRYLGHHDPLTGLYSRAFMEAELSRLQDSREYPVSFIMTDLDKLKKVNDKFGHAVGDELLRRAASVIRSAFRSEDIIARMGGDEFTVILPSTDGNAAQEAIERIHKAVARESRAGIDPKLKISLGCATAQQNESLEHTLKKADRNMYSHKQVNYSQKD